MVLSHQESFATIDDSLIERFVVLAYHNITTFERIGDVNLTAAIVAGTRTVDVVGVEQVIAVRSTAADARTIVVVEVGDRTCCSR